MPSGGIKHRFVSAKPDGADATKVRKSNWNDELDVTNPTAVKADLAITQSDVSGLTAALAAKAATSSLAAIATSGSATDLAAGAVPAARMPAHTGDVTSSAGAVALTIAPAVVSLAKMANLAANSIIGNNTGSSATPIALTVAQALTMLGLTSLKAVGKGNGSDGAAVMDGSTAVAGCTLSSNVYTATRECFFTTLTISVGVTFKPDGFEQSASGLVTNNGKISTSGGDASGATPGITPFSASARPLPGGTAGSTGNGTAILHAVRGASATAAVGGSSPSGNGTAGGACHGGGGGGGASAGGANGGAVTLMTVTNPGFGDWMIQESAFRGRPPGSSSNPSSSFDPSSSGGGGGAAGASVPGAGGGSGGWMTLHFADYTGSGTIESKGGAGGIGTSTFNGGVGGNVGAGGGGGGAGGIVVLHLGLGVTAPVLGVGVLVTGGAGGAGGAGIAGFVGGNGGAGGDGLFQLIQ